MTSRILVPLVAALLAAAIIAPQPTSQDGLTGVSPGQEFVVTLRTHDPMTAAVDFDAGGYGADLEGAQIGLHRAELCYGLFEPGLLSFSLREREQALIIDVGPFVVPPIVHPRDRALRPAASVLSTMSFSDRKVTYSAPPDKSFNLREAASITGILPEPGIQHIKPKVGHVFVMRYRGVAETQDAFGRVVAFTVLDVVPGQSCTLRGKILPGSP